jgi:hypothetical protein
MRFILVTFCLVFSLQSPCQDFGIDVAIYSNSCEPQFESRLREKVENLVYSKFDDIEFRSFLVTARLNSVQSKQTNTIPSKFIEVISIQLLAGNPRNGDIYSTQIITSKGIGSSRNEAINNAITKVNSSAIEINFLREASIRSRNYYLDNCELILSKAESMLKMNDLEGVIASLSEIPLAESECYQKSRIIINLAIDSFLEKECSDLLRQANAVWSAQPDEEGGLLAIQYIQKIESDYCDTAVDKLLTEIKAKMINIDSREWEFALQRYNDQQELKLKEFDLEKEKQIQDFQIRKVLAERPVRNYYIIKSPFF